VILATFKDQKGAKEFYGCYFYRADLKFLGLGIRLTKLRRCRVNDVPENHGRSESANGKRSSQMAGTPLVYWLGSGCRNRLACKQIG